MSKSTDEVLTFCLRRHESGRESSFQPALWLGWEGPHPWLRAWTRPRLRSPPTFRTLSKTQEETNSQTPAANRCHTAAAATPLRHFPQKENYSLSLFAIRTRGRHSWCVDVSVKINLGFFVFSAGFRSIVGVEVLSRPVGITLG